MKALFVICDAMDGMRDRMRVDSGRRSFVLLTVLAVIGSALLVATGMLFSARAEMAGRHAALDAIQSRTLAWSGIQAVMAELNRQRPTILAGRIPQLETQYTIYETQTQRGLVRLLPFDSEGALLIPEASRLDLNSTDAELLSAIEMIDPAIVADIIAYRDQTLQRPFQSVSELLNVDGITPELLYGRAEELILQFDISNENENIADALASQQVQLDSPRSLANLVTVFGFEPPLQRNGELRLNVNIEWSDELDRRLNERFNQGDAEVIRALMISTSSLDSDRSIYQALRTFNVEPRNWPNIIDAITTDTGRYHFGRIDINTASEEVLEALPGIEPDQAAQLVRARESVPSEDLATIAWPAIHQVLQPEQYDLLADWMTVRSWTYRVRIAAGVVDGDNTDAPMRSSVVYEAVIDLADPTPRVAYLREITTLPVAIELAMTMQSGDQNDPIAPESSELLSDTTIETSADNSIMFGGEEFVVATNEMEPSPLSLSITERANSDQNSVKTEDAGGTGSDDRRIGRWRPVGD